MNLSHVHPQDGYVVAMRAAIEGLRPEPELHLDQWSEDEMVLPRSSSQPGPYRIFRMYPSRRVLQCLSPGHPARRVVVRGASQMLKTQCGLNAIGGWIHRAPANILALEPSDKLAKRLSARIQQAAKDVEVLRNLMPQQRSRDSRNTVDAKEFPGGTLYIVTAGSAANLAEIPARYLFLDEVDRMDASVDGEGDPVEIAEARTTRFSSNCKIYAVSSPTVKGFSKIDELYERGTQEVYLVPCPSCQHMHELVVENFHYCKDAETLQITRAWFTCPSCGADIDEHHKGTMLRDVVDGGLAHWHAQALGDGETVSFHINAFYSPFGSITWLQLARQYDRAKERAQKGDRNGLRVFWNTRLALSYDDVESRTTSADLMKRAEPYQPRVLPMAALVATMSVDTQGNRLEVQIEAWGPGMEHWVIDYQVLDGSPTEPPDSPTSVWARLDAIRTTPLLHESGVQVFISAYAIDSGGHNTQDVYNYGHGRANHGCLIIKGASRPNRPIVSGVPTKQDIDWGGQRLPNSALLWTVGTDVAKDWLFNRMQLAAGPGAMHFHKQLEKAWFDGLVAEQRVTKYRKGKVITEYQKAAGDRNEPLDLSVYNLAVAYHLGLHKFSPLDWQRLRDQLIPRAYTPDMFGPEAPAPALAAPVVEAAPVAAPAAAPVVAPGQVSVPAPAVPAASTHGVPHVWTEAVAPSPAPEAVAAVATPAPTPTPSAPTPPSPPHQVATPTYPAAAGRRVISRGIR
jgi:phage terminase large subunit GpA-like protein